MRSPREATTTESHHPTARGLPMVVLDARAGRTPGRAASTGAARRPVVHRSTQTSERTPPAGACTVTRLHPPDGRADTAPRPAPDGLPLAPAAPEGRLPSPRGPAPIAHYPPPAESTVPSLTACASLTPRASPADTLELPGAVRAYAVAAATRRTSSAGLRAEPTRVAPGLRQVEVRASVAINFSPVEKGILILAGFSVVAVVISTLFHG